MLLLKRKDLFCSHFRGFSLSWKGEGGELGHLTPKPVDARKERQKEGWGG